MQGNNNKLASLLNGFVALAIVLAVAQEFSSPSPAKEPAQPPPAPAAPPHKDSGQYGAKPQKE